MPYILSNLYSLYNDSLRVLLCENTCEIKLMFVSMSKSKLFFFWVYIDGQSL
jgi:hypothetical protein